MKTTKPTNTSKILSQDTLHEMIYDKENQITSFVTIDRSGEIKVDIQEINIGKKVYIPYDPTNSFLQSDTVRFPSSIEDYSNEKELLNEIIFFIHKYVDVTPAFEKIAAHYVLLTWLYDKFYTLPYLRALGDYGSGKSRFLKTIEGICYKPMIAGGATTSSPIFRIIEEFQGTLILDEADMRYSDMTSDIVKILNSGYEEGSPLLRTESKKGQFEIKSFRVFCPKIIATRERYHDVALESRFLVEEMGERKLRDDIPRSLNEEFHEESLTLRNKLLKWRLDHFFSPVSHSHNLVQEIHPRLQQITLPLFSIIKDDSTKKNLELFITKYNDTLIEQRDLSWESDVVLALLRLEHKSKSRSVTVKDITHEVNQSYDYEDHLTPRKVGSSLKRKLRMRTQKTRNGFVFDFEVNKSKLSMWKERYGITDEMVNVVNDVNVKKMLRDEDIPVINN